MDTDDAEEKAVEKNDCCERGRRTAEMLDSGAGELNSSHSMSPTDRDGPAGILTRGIQSCVIYRALVKPFRFCARDLVYFNSASKHDLSTRFEAQHSGSS